MSCLLIVDGHAYAYRAFYAIRELRGPDGRPTNAIFGFVKMLEKLRAGLKPEQLLVIWDGGLSPARMAVWPEYKSQRPEMPEELRPQLDAISRYLAAAGVAEYRQPEVEADDAIATLARRAAGEGRRVVIASGDKDFMQLVSDRVGLINPNDATGAVWTEEQVRAKTGVAPAQVADWLALVGDTVDNIPGVPGVGPKTAAALLGQFGSVSEIFRRLDEVKPERIRLALGTAAAAVQRNLALVRLPDVPMELGPGQLVPGPADSGRLAELYRSWGFRGLLAALGGEAAGQQPNLI